MSLNILLVSDTMIKDRTSIHGNIDSKLLYPDIKVAQDMYILPLLGSALFDKMQSLVSSGAISIAGNEDYKLLLDKYIIDTLIYYTLSELPTTISYQFWNKGVSRKLGVDSENPSMSELIDLSNKYKNRAEFYSERAKRYLLSSVTKYKEYLNFGNTIESINPNQRTFTSPIYLGGGDDCCDNSNSWFPQQPYKP